MSDQRGPPPLPPRPGRRGPPPLPPRAGRVPLAARGPPPLPPRAGRVPLSARGPNVIARPGTLPEAVRTVRVQLPPDVKKNIRTPPYVQLPSAWKHGPVPAGAYIHRRHYRRRMVKSNYIQTYVFPAMNASFEIDNIRLEFKQAGVIPESIQLEVEIGDAIGAPVTSINGTTPIANTKGNLLPIYEWWTILKLFYINDTSRRIRPLEHMYEKWCLLSETAWTRECYNDAEVHPLTRIRMFEQPNHLHVTRLTNVERILSSFKAAIVVYNTNAFTVELEMKDYNTIYYGTSDTGSLTPTRVNSEGELELVTMYVPRARPKINFFRLRVSGAEVTDAEAKHDKMLLKKGIHIIDVETIEELFTVTNPDSYNELHFTLQSSFGRVVEILVEFIVKQNYNPAPGIANRVGNHIPGRYSNDPFRIRGSDAAITVGPSSIIKKIFNQPCPVLYFRSGLIGVQAVPVRNLIPLSADYLPEQFQYRFPDQFSATVPILGVPFSEESNMSRHGVDTGYVNANGDIRFLMTGAQPIIDAVRQKEINFPFYTDLQDIQIRFLTLVQMIYSIDELNFNKRMLSYARPDQVTH